MAQSRDNDTSLAGCSGSHHSVLSTHHFLHVPWVNSSDPDPPDKNFRVTGDSHVLPGSRRTNRTEQGKNSTSGAPVQRGEAAFSRAHS